MRNIYLVGFMGTGKTVTGKEVAKRLNQQFLDLDFLIEEREKKKISQIFAEDGEAHFRSLEKQVLREVSEGEDLVVSCGGGIVLDRENIQIMKKAGLMICLSSRPGVILRRTQGYNHRPLLEVDDPKKRVEELLKIRAPFYAQADYIIDTSDLAVSEVTNKVLEIARKTKNKPSSGVND